MAPPANMYQPGTVLTVGSHTAVIKKYFSEGGFAHVYQVEISPSENNTSVACLKRVAVPDKQSLNNLRAEVDSMKRLSGHRHIVSYIDSHAARMTDGSSGYEVFVLMEFCANKGLIDFMNTRLQNRLTEPEVLRIMGEVTEGVCNMHALSPPLIHRDIKIENVLISGNGDYKLCDFGSASLVLRPPRNADEFAILQNDVLTNTTPQYRSPEMIDLYKGLPIDEKSDIWALGVFLYKLCYYTTPFEAKGELAILHARFDFPARPQYSNRLKNLISVLLREDPRRRPNAYQTLEEVCNMRGIPVPISDYTKKKDVPHLSSKPQPPPKTQIPIQNIPISRAKYGYGGIPPNSTTDLNAINNSSNLTATSATQPTDPFENFNPSNLKLHQAQSSTLPQKQHHHIASSMQNLNKSMGSLSLNKPNAPVIPPKPKYVDSVVQTEEDVRPWIPVRPHRARPQSMYVKSSENIKTNDTGELKKLISGLSQEQNYSRDDARGENHIDSNVDFLKNLEQQDSGKSWVQQTTGGSLKSLRRISTGNRKMVGLINSFTGKFSRSSSRSTSNASSIHESAEIDTYASRASAEIREDDISKVPLSAVPKLSGSSSIQRRVKQLMNRANDPPIVKTAKGYGNDSMDEQRSRRTSIDSDGFIKPTLYKRTQPKTPPHSAKGTPSTPPTLTKAPKNSINDSISPQSTVKKKAPPPKPKKPKHLKSKGYAQVAENDTAGQYLKVSNNGGLVKVQSLGSEISDIDEWEKNFHERYPNAF